LNLPANYKQVSFVEERLTFEPPRGLDIHLPC
jgi:hypothetical protein